MATESPDEPPNSTGRAVRTALITLLACMALAYVLNTIPSEEQFAITGAGFGLLLGFFLGRANRLVPTRNQRQQFDGRPNAPPALVTHPELLLAYNSLTHYLIELSGQTDDILKESIILRLADIQKDVRGLASGKVIFSGTEAWRTTYERLLRAPGLSRYLSVAWLRSEDYWRDAPGRHSLQLNFELIQLGLGIERTLILNDFFWPSAALLPAKVICTWMDEQHKRGVVLRLVRESQVTDEAELLCDFGIYGDRACGQLELDQQCRTERFTLDFNPQSVELFKERWRRLLLFSVPYQELLDQKAGGT
jgi:hypothetical protein